MLYQVIVKKAGNTVNTIHVEATDALAAIEQVEAGYSKMRVHLFGKDNRLTSVLWSGFEFEARCLPIVQIPFFLEMQTTSPTAQLVS